LKVRARLLRTWPGPLPAAARLPKGYLLEVASDWTVCEACGRPLRRQRSSTRYPLGVMLGQPRVRYVEKKCICCGKVYPPESYHQLVPPQGNYAFDLIVAVGLARFRQHQQNREIQQQLQGCRELLLPSSTINELAHTFLDCLAATHEAAAPQLRKRLEEDGGYVLHVDGTCEPGTDTVFNAVAGNRGWTLAGTKMSGEDVKQIAGLMRRCVESFGTPLALVRDLSPQIETAGKEALAEVLDLVCQYHFLENVGSKLYEKPHAKLTAALRRLKIQPPLRSLRTDLVRSSKQKGCLSAEQVAQCLQSPQRLADLEPLQARRTVTYLVLRWLEDYVADLRGEYFPFDLPSLAFYRRGRQVYDWLVEVTGTADFPQKEFSTLATITRHLAPLREDAEVVAAAARLEKAEALFEELRGLLRLSSAPLGPVLHRRVPADAPAIAAEREKSFRMWKDQLHQRLASEGDTDKADDLKAVLGYVEKYQEKLSGHVIPRPNRVDPFVVERTNNVSEHRFGTTKQGLRRKVGTKKLTRLIQAMRPEELLIANLEDPEYLEILCGGKLENLPALFAHNWKAGQAIRTDRRKKTSNHPIPIRKKTLRDAATLPHLKQAIEMVIAMTRSSRYAA
jgi:hypothetical protein